MEEPLPRLPTGLADVDRLLGGGLPAGRLSELHGAHSSGRTSLVLSLLAGLTRRGECVAVVDRADALDPASAVRSGVSLERLLWARAPDWRGALRCTERLLETEGFPLVVLDLGRATGDPGGRELRSGHEHPGGRERRGRGFEGPGDTTWLRLARLAASTRTALLLLSGDRLTGAHAEMVLEMQPARARFGGSPALLEGLDAQVVLARHRAAPAGRAASVRWRPSSAA